MQIAMPDPNDNSGIAKIYHAIVDALPDEGLTIEVILALGMLLSSVIIEHAKNKEARIKIAQKISEKIAEACEAVPSQEEIAAGAQPVIPEKYQTRH